MLPNSFLLGDPLNRLALLVAMLLIISFFINAGLLNKIGAQIPIPVPSISNAPAVSITFPHHFDKVNLGDPLNISVFQVIMKLTDVKFQL